jgi:hypothetical protein
MFCWGSWLSRDMGEEPIDRLPFLSFLSWAALEAAT